MHTEGTTAVEVRDLVKRYPKSTRNAVDGLSFSVVAGEVFGLLGPNGAGKSTAIGILTTRVLATSGSATVSGVDVVHDPVSARAQLAVVPQRVFQQANCIGCHKWHGGGGGGYGGDALSLRATQLDRDQISRIVKIQLERVQTRLKDRKIKLQVTESAVQLLASMGYDPNYGARPVKRVIQQSMENELARLILKGEIKEEDTVMVDTELTSVAGGGLPQQKLTFKKLEATDASNPSVDADSPVFVPGLQN